MPAWMDAQTLVGWEPRDGAVLREATGIAPRRQEELDPSQVRGTHERFTMIAPTLPCIGDMRERVSRIREVAEASGVTAQTVRRHLCLYLAYPDICILAPAGRTPARPLTADEENMRWALNKFFYSTQKQSLMTASTMMLKERYCDSEGTLLDAHPSFYQFPYFHRRTRKPVRTGKVSGVCWSTLSGTLTCVAPAPERVWPAPTRHREGANT